MTECMADSTPETFVGYPIQRNSKGEVRWIELSGDQYAVTGVDRDGKRFRLDYRSWDAARQINLYRGTRWLVREGRKHKINEVFN